MSRWLFFCLDRVVSPAGDILFSNETGHSAFRGGILFVPAKRMQKLAGVSPGRLPAFASSL